MVLFQTAFSFTDAIDYLVDIGVYEVFLPFLLIFAIIFAVLEKTKVLGTDKSNINGIVAVVIGLLVVVQTGIVEIINSFLPRVSLIIVVILMGLLIIAMMAGKEFEGLKEGALGFGVIVTIIAIILALTGTPGSSSWLTSADREALLRIGIPLLIFLGVIWFVVRKPKTQNEEGGIVGALKKLGGQIK